MEPSPLATSPSPFLRHGATQPVRWQPWGDAAFERARRENRPVLLDIGAVWCHWCHVMDRESYEDEETARLINELYVPVKVDRDERPDVDARYQRAVQALTGQGGWPLTAILTPDGDAFFGGTYFPPDERYGRPSFRRVLTEVARVWREEPRRAVAAAGELRERLAATVDRVESGEPGAELVEGTVEAFAREFDFRFGGFGHAPKFPNAGALALLLDHDLDGGPEWSRRVITETLDAMARGGIHDQLFGGFHRYATDARWLVPHFEKMASDNAVLLDVYARAAAVYGSELYARTARGIVRFFTELAPEVVAAGGFPASQDADVGPDDDGDYWTWTREELREALGERSFEVAVRHFGVDDPGSAMPTDPSRHVLFQATREPPPELDDIRAKLLAVRERRPRPYVDTSVYASWTAMAASGMLAAARYAGIEGASAPALRALGRLWEEGFAEGRGVAHRPGHPEAGEYLEDQAHFAAALLDAFEWTQEAHWLERARDVARTMLARFRDPATGALNDRPRDAAATAAPLERPHTPITDSPDPSGNGIAALALLRLGELGGDEARDAAHAILRAFAGTAQRIPTAMATYVRAVDRATSPHTDVVVIAERGSPLLRAALSTYRPRTTVLLHEPGAPTDALPDAVRAMVTGEAPRAYVCSGRTCAAPVADAASLVKLVREFRG